MAVVRCEGGHYYDDEKFSRCPHCGIFTNIELGKTQKRGLYDDDKTVQLKLSEADLNRLQEHTVSLADSSVKASDDQKTIGHYSADKGNECVTGWLVCVKGDERGRDYRLHHGFNYIGRGYDMSICIVDDQSISRSKHCAIVYDDRSNAFSLVPIGGNLVYRCGESVTQPVRILTGDIIEIGKSEFEFIAFCREGRIWEKE